MRPERIELPTSWFVAMRSIQLSYGRILGEFASSHYNGNKFVRESSSSISNRKIAQAR